LLRHSLGPGAGRADCVSVYLGQVWASRHRLANEASSMVVHPVALGTAALCGLHPELMHYDNLALTRYIGCPLLKEEGTKKLSLINAPLGSLLTHFGTRIRDAAIAERHVRDHLVVCSRHLATRQETGDPEGVVPVRQGYGTSAIRDLLGS
jgi:hypothetical protein